ncbi:MAG: 6-O-methylguanine DNA methyltransferase [Candidatus Vogelbacteria bacterium CG10_big_fil_rev_8_21_14_0_10_45_14]|uniref:6-O-methylguanine DNA methyltransferase n=1 Tax=Candidatus Vogelbacteria bacterium CG10_big_fil_rev_8_21_14_0_10_45_14 TaxID=1975042 RepID=A0A2H0RJV8_9BACT|nr:MAG: 6-O-methylguanine DNA methyltransferase [Candidatus Vogelbacteria bacterium CG10_big_fil_rev_8_21_14_0_10_45_14]
MSKTDTNSTRSFKDKVYDVVRGIPSGKTLSYKEVAKLAGNKGAYRAVGWALSQNTDKNVPCHRVIGSDGKAGGYNGLRGNKEKLLEKERKHDE